jgi:hypothetical protein
MTGFRLRGVCKGYRCRTTWQVCQALIFLPFFLVSAPLSGQTAFSYVLEGYDLFFSNANLLADRAETIFSREDSAFGQRARLISRYTFDDFYREKRGGGIHRRAGFWQQTNALFYPLQLGKNRYIIGARSQISRKEIAWENPPDESFHFESETATYALNAKAPVWRKAFYLEAELGRKNVAGATSLPWAVGAEIALWKAVRISYRGYQEQFAWRLGLRYRNAPVKLEAPQGYRGHDYQARLQVASKLFFAARLQKNAVTSDLKFAENLTALLLAGDEHRSAFSVELAPLKHLAVMFAYRERRGKLGGRFYESQESFGKLTALNDSARVMTSQATFKLNSHTWRAAFSWGDGAFSGRGHIESWPFTSTWIDLLGARYYFKANMEYRLKRFEASYQWVRQDWHAQLALCAERFHPLGEIRGWEPLFLVFGQRNLKVNSLSATRQDGIYLAVTLAKNFGKLISVYYEFNQYVPVKARKRSDASSQADPSAPAIGAKRNVYGGGKHTLQVGFNF